VDVTGLSIGKMPENLGSERERRRSGLFLAVSDERVHILLEFGDARVGIDPVFPHLVSDIDGFLETLFYRFHFSVPAQ